MLDGHGTQRSLSLAKMLLNPISARSLILVPILTSAVVNGKKLSLKVKLKLIILEFLAEPTDGSAETMETKFTQTRLFAVFGLLDQKVTGLSLNALLALEPKVLELFKKKRWLSLYAVLKYMVIILKSIMTKMPLIILKLSSTSFGQKTVASIKVILGTQENW
jgi:hypothetical protein